MKTRVSPVVIVLLAAAAVACDVSNSSPLPAGYNEAVTRAFTVHLDEPLNGQDGTPLHVRAFAGLDGSPRSPQGESALAFSQRAGIRVLRYPKGWGCQLSLNSIFPDPTADPSKAASYQMDAIQGPTVELASRSILPMWQSLYDIGTDACTSIDGVGKGSRIGDVDTWAAVCAGVTDRLSRATSPYYNDATKARLALQGLKTGYIEFLPDAMATAGYAKGGLASLLPVYVAWRRAFDAAFPEGGATRVQALVGPSLPASGVADVTTKGRLLKDFLDYVELQPTLAPEVLSFLSYTGSPEEHLALVEAVRKALVDMGLAQVQVADTGLRLSADAWDSLVPIYDTQVRRSAYLGAFLASVKILEQDDLDLLVADRWGGLRATSDAIAGEDLFQADDGEPLPALLSLTPFFRMDLDEATRVAVDSVPWPAAPAATNDVIQPAEGVHDAPADLANDAVADIAKDLSPAAADVSLDVPRSDAVVADVPDAGVEATPEGDVLRVMAAKTKAGGLTAVIVSLPPASPAKAGVRMRYQIDVEGLPVSKAGWVVRRYHYDATTSGFRGPVEQSGVVPVNGRVRIVRDITGPAIDHIEILTADLVQ